MPVSLSDPAARRRYVVLLASLLFMFVGTGSVYFVVIALKPIAAEFDWPRAVPSIAYALQYGGAGVGGIFMGWILDRRGLGIPAFTGGAMIGSGAILTAYISSPWEFYFVHGVMLGFFGRSTLFAPLTANITRWFENSKSIAVGIIGSGQGIAGMVWPQTFHYLIEAVGWRQAALYYGLFALATLLPLATILRWQPPLAGPVAPPVHPADPHAAIQPVAPPSPPRPVLTPLSIQLTLCIAAIGCCVAMSLPLAHIVSYVSDLGYDRARGAEVLSIMLGSAALASLIGVSYLGTRFGGLRAIFVFSTGQAALLGVFTFIDSLAALYVAAALFGLGYGGILPCYPVIVRELLPAREAGRRTGLVLLCAGGGMALGSWLGGYSYDLTGSYRPAFLTGVAFNLGNLALIASLIVRTKSRAVAQPA